MKLSLPGATLITASPDGQSITIILVVVVVIGGNDTTILCWTGDEEQDQEQLHRPFN